MCTCICKRWKGGWRASSKCRITSVWRESRIHIEHSICVIYRTIHCNPIPCNSCYSYILSLSLFRISKPFLFFALHRSACIALNPNFITFEKDTHCSNSNSNATKKDMQWVNKRTHSSPIWLSNWNNLFYQTIFPIQQFLNSFTCVRIGSYAKIHWKSRTFRKS